METGADLDGNLLTPLGKHSICRGRGEREGKGGQWDGKEGGRKGGREGGRERRDGGREEREESKAWLKHIHTYVGNYLLYGLGICQSIQIRGVAPFQGWGEFALGNLYVCTYAHDTDIHTYL